MKRQEWGIALVDVGVMAVCILKALAADDWRAERENLERQRLILDQTRQEIAQIEPVLMRTIDSIPQRAAALARARSEILGATA